MQSIESEEVNKKVKGDYTVDQVISKAQTLIEALPYIKKFQGKTYLIRRQDLRRSFFIIIGTDPVFNYF